MEEVILVGRVRREVHPPRAPLPTEAGNQCEELALLDLDRLIDGDPVELHRAQLPVVIEYPEERARPVVKLDLLAALALELAANERTRDPVEICLLRRVPQRGVVPPEDHARAARVLEREQEIFDHQADRFP